MHVGLAGSLTNTPPLLPSPLPPPQPPQHPSSPPLHSLAPSPRFPTNPRGSNVVYVSGGNVKRPWSINHARRHEPDGHARDSKDNTDTDTEGQTRHTVNGSARLASIFARRQVAEGGVARDRMGQQSKKNGMW